MRMVQLHPWSLVTVVIAIAIASVCVLVGNHLQQRTPAQAAITQPDLTDATPMELVGYDKRDGWRGREFSGAGLVNPTITVKLGNLDAQVGDEVLLHDDGNLTILRRERQQQRIQLPTDIQVHDGGYLLRFFCWSIPVKVTAHRLNVPSRAMNELAAACYAGIAYLDDGEGNKTPITSFIEIE